MKKESFQGILLGIVIMCAVFAFITVAWAAFSSNLTIGGTATVKAQNWKVVFSKTAGGDFTADSPETYALLAPTAASSSTVVYDSTNANKFRLSTSIAATGNLGTLTMPGDKVVYEWYVNNLGTFGADVQFTGDLLAAANSAGSNMNITCTYADSTSASTFCASNVKALLEVEGVANLTSSSTFSLGQASSAGKSKKITLTLEYLTKSGSGGEDISELASQDITISLASGITLTAAQSSTTQATTAAS